MAFIAFIGGLFIYAFIRVLVTGFFTVRPDQRAVLTSFGRAQRLTAAVDPDPALSEKEQERYQYPAIRVIAPGGPYFKWPWQAMMVATTMLSKPCCLRMVRAALVDPPVASIGSITMVRGLTMS